MPQYQYRVTMKTPLGSRDGHLLLSTRGTRIRGTLRILGSSNTVSGRLLPDGSCTLAGKIQTLVRTIPYTADGCFDAASIELTIHGERNTMPLQGTSIP